MAEFLVALAVLVPLFMAVAYAGKYGDINQSATQASRYAAFQRAMQPDAAKLSNDKIADQMRARFFLDGDYLHKGRLQSDDSVAQIKKGQGQSAMWLDLGGAAMLASPDKVTVNWAPAAVGTGTVTKMLDVMTKTAGKTYPGGQVARVEITLGNKLDLSTASPKPLVLAAATATAGNGLGSSGSKATRDAAATIVPSDKVPNAVSGFLTTALSMFEPEGPVIGCIKPDVVPGHRLDGPADNSKCK